jgi:hypothetical protein
MGFMDGLAAGQVFDNAGDLGLRFSTPSAIDDGIWLGGSGAEASSKFSSHRIMAGILGPTFSDFSPQGGMPGHRTGGRK